jgi:hypothetical protein
MAIILQSTRRRLLATAAAGAAVLGTSRQVRANWLQA